MCIFKTMSKTGATATPEEVNIKEEMFKAIVLLCTDESRYGQIFE